MFNGTTSYAQHYPDNDQDTRTRATIAITYYNLTDYEIRLKDNRASRVTIPFVHYSSNQVKTKGTN